MIFVLKYILIFAVAVVVTGCGDEVGTPSVMSNSFLVCETQDIVKKVKSDPPVLHECSAGSIRSADMLALVAEGVTDEELLAVWSLDGYSGFTPAQLKVAGLSFSEMQAAGLSLWQIHVGGVSVAELRVAGVSLADLRSHGITPYQLHAGGFTISQMQAAGLSILQMYTGGVRTADLQSASITLSQMRNAGISISEIHAGGVSLTDLLQEDDLSILNLHTKGIPRNVIFNEACNTASTNGAAPGPRITSVTTTDTHVVVQAQASGSLTWNLSSTSGGVSFDGLNSVNDPHTLGNATARLLSRENNIYISTLGIPFADIFSNPSVVVADSQDRRTSINLCPGH